MTPVAVKRRLKSTIITTVDLTLLWQNYQLAPTSLVNKAIIPVIASNDT